MNQLIKVSRNRRIVVPYHVWVCPHISTHVTGIYISFQNFNFLAEDNQRLKKSGVTVVSKSSCEEPLTYREVVVQEVGLVIVFGTKARGASASMRMQAVGADAGAAARS